MDKEKALNMALGQIDRQFGKGAVMRLGDRAASMNIEAIPTGSIALDIALGVGGFPRGRVVELFGPESSGKSTVALHAVAEAQRLGGVAAFIDAEHALDPVYAGNIGVDIDALLVSQPDTGEQALEIADMLIRSGAIDIVVVDSVAALVPRAEIEGEMGDTHVGLQARLMSQAMRKLTASVSKSKTCIIFINQIREKVGILFGSPETTPGGRALKFYSSVRLDVRRVESIKDGQDFIGNRVRAKVVKNKCLAEGTTVFDPTTGLTHRIEDVVEKGEGSSVYAIDKLGKLHIRPIGDRMVQGEQDVIGLRFRGNTVLWVTPDHRVFTEHGWQEAGDLHKGMYVARPRRVGGFGSAEPVPPEHARLLGYLIGDGYVGGKTPITFINCQEPLRDDAARIAAELGCDAKLRGRHGIELAFSHRIGESNGVIELARWAGIWGHLAPEKKIAAAFFAPDVSEEVVANLLFGIWESDGWISREQTGGIRCGFVTTSEQLAHQIHWLLLRWGIGSSTSVHEPGSRRSVIDGRRVVGKRPCWQVRVSGLDNVRRFAEALPTWGPRGQILEAELSRPELGRHRGSQRVYLPPSQTEPVLAYLRECGIGPRTAAQLIGAEFEAGRGLTDVLGVSRLRRDRLEKLADALDSEFLRSALDEDVYYERIFEVLPKRRARTYDIEVEELHSFVADDVVVHNCAPPFLRAEFDLMFSKGISKEGSLLDVAVDHGIVSKSGAWYQYDGEQIGQGRENAKDFLTENADVCDEIERLVRAAISPNGDAPDEAEVDAEEAEDPTDEEEKEPANA